jgi:hypothetical protein
MSFIGDPLRPFIVAISSKQGGRRGRSPRCFSVPGRIFNPRNSLTQFRRVTTGHDRRRFPPHLFAVTELARCCDHCRYRPRLPHVHILRAHDPVANVRPYGSSPPSPILNEGEWGPKVSCSQEFVKRFVPSPRERAGHRSRRTQFSALAAYLAAAPSSCVERRRSS